MLNPIVASLVDGAMNARDAQVSRLLVTPSAKLPSATDVKSLMARLGIDNVSEAVVDQLVRAAAAADRWLADRPEEAARFVEDPAGAMEAMQRAGLLTGGFADLLDVLRALGARREKKSTERSRLARILRPKIVSFGPKPALRLKSEPYRATRKSKGGR
jgi:hypothetical protein